MIRVPNALAKMAFYWVLFIGVVMTGVPGGGLDGPLVYAVTAWGAYDVLTS